MSFDLARGDSPVILAFPHVGTALPGDLHARLNPNGRLLADTDWHVDRLYDGLLPGATTIRATTHRYAIDLNRDPSGTSLYPGRNTTALVPTTDFDGNPIWQAGQAPTQSEIATLIETIHAPYHDALRTEIARIKALHGVAILYDAHSIRSRIPFLFEGQLPDLNIGTADRSSCDPRLADTVMDMALSAKPYTAILNGRFKGGWTTRAHADPARGIHTLQMELAQATHLASETPPFAFDPARAAPLRTLLGTMLARLEQLAPSLAAGAAR